jgi:hypothetical protein
MFAGLTRLAEDVSELRAGVRKLDAGLDAVEAHQRQMDATLTVRPR